MDVDVDKLNAYTTIHQVPLQWHGPSDVVEAARTRVPSLEGTIKVLSFWTRPWLTWCGLNTHPELYLKESKRNDMDWHATALTEIYTHLPLRHWHTLVIVTDTHQHVDRVLYTYMTLYLAQAYRLSINFWWVNPLINRLLIRLSIDNRFFW